MARRRIIEQPTSRFAIWSLRTATFGLVVTTLAVLIIRGDFLEIMPALVTMAAALSFAVLAIFLALGAFIVVWRDGIRGLRRALLAMLIGFAMLAYPAYIGLRGYRLPPISDVTTDFIDPPRFEAIARVRPRDANSVAYPGAAAAAKQRAAYPDIEPLVVNATPQELYDAALSVITRRKWRIVDERRPQLGRRDGHIEAIARTPIMGFRDDVVIRIRAPQGGARLDARSASRYGDRDFGSNAQRLRSLITDIDDALANQPAKRQ